MSWDWADATRAFDKNLDGDNDPDTREGGTTTAEREAVADALAGSRGTGWVRTDCPLCADKTGKPDRKQSLGYNTATGGFNCFAAETRVQTWEGPRAIGSLAGQEVRLLTSALDVGGGYWADAPIASFGVQRLWRVVLTRNGVRKEVRATAGHRWFVRSGERWREVVTSELRPGHRLRPVREPRSGSLAPSPWGVAHGFAFGDGAQMSRPSRGVRGFFCGEKDKAMLRFYPLSESREIKPGVLRIDGLPRFFKALPSPDETPSYLYGWLAGYFAADGCVDETGMPTIACANRATLEAVRVICSRIGVFTFGIRQQTRRGFGVLSNLYSLSFGRGSLSEAFFLLSHHQERWRANQTVKERVGWTVESVADTGVDEEVFCATVNGVGAFALEDNILTGNCFKCGSTGRLTDEQRDALPTTRLRPGQPLPEPEPVEGALGYLPLYAEPGWSIALFDPIREYLAGRGLQEAALADAGVGTGAFGKLVNRVVVPIPDYSDPYGPWRGWVARDVTGLADRKYLYPKSMNREGVLYAEPALYDPFEESPVMVVEGTLDAISLWGDAVALLGKPLESQFDKLCRSLRPVAVVMDGDAWQDGWALAMKLRFHGVRAGHVRLPPTKDPDEVPRAWLDEEARRCLDRP